MRKLIILALMGIAMLNYSVKAQKVYDFVSVDTPPTYPGGIKNFYAYMSKEIIFPEQAKKDNVNGKVFLSFIVDQNGSIKNVNVTKGLTKETDAEAIRVIKNTPKWNPGKIGGKSVSVKYNIPIQFSQTGNSTPIKRTTKSVVMPEFPGGTDKLYTYLAKNIKYPEQAKKDGVQGKVTLAFNVEKDGTLTDLEVIKGLSKETNEEAIRVMKKAPRWNPAIGKDGHPVKVKYRMAVNFSLG